MPADSIVRAKRVAVADDERACHWKMYVKSNLRSA
jgi:hypothetical protein